MRIELHTKNDIVVLMDERYIDDSTISDALDIIVTFDALTLVSNKDDDEIWLEIDNKGIGYKEIETEDELIEFYKELHSE